MLAYMSAYYTIKFIDSITVNSQHPERNIPVEESHSSDGLSATNTEELPAGPGLVS